MSDRPNSDLDRSRLWLQISSCLGVFALMAVTYPLWWFASQRDFPQVPFFAALLPAAEAFDVFFVIAFSVAVIFTFVTSVLRLRQPDRQPLRRWDRTAWSAACVFCLVTALLDQFRLQPWLYQFGIFAGLFALTSNKQGNQLLRWIFVSIYVYSAVGKLDYQFVHTVGQDFLQVLLRWLGQDLQEYSATTATRLACVFPAVELLLAGLLAWRPTRRFGCVLAIGFHLGLACMFSPLGLGHSWGVILWNVQFAIQIPIMFAAPAAAWPSSKTAQPTETRPLAARSADFVATGLVLIVCIAPILERFGGWDHWTSWALYSPHSSRCEVLVATTAVERLPMPLRRLMEESDQDDDRAEFQAVWNRVPIERWSLRVNHAPLYPQSRSGLAIGRFLHGWLGTDYEVQVRVRSLSARWSGRRTETRAMNALELTRVSKQFFLNTQPTATAAPE